MLEARRPLKSRNTRWAKALASWLVRKRVSPNAISVLGMVFATGGGAALVLYGLYAPGCACLLLAGVAGAQLRLV